MSGAAPPAAPLAPGSADEAAAALAEASEAGRTVRIAGARTKPWGHPVGEPGAVISTAAMDALLEHNAGDLTAVVQPGLPLAAAQDAFAAEGQMLALDPPLGAGSKATVGGVVAAGDSGPLRGRYGTARDLVVGMTAVLSDGTVARSGGRVIKNVAGYDLAKLFGGSMGTLGLIAELAVRLHPRPERTATAVGRVRDPGSLGDVAAATTAAPLEHEGLDVRWHAGAGEVLARFGGAAPRPQAEHAVQLMRRAGADAELVDEGDDELWERQRLGQRAADGGTVVKVSGLQTELAATAVAADAAGASVVGRLPLAVWWLALEDRPVDDAVAAVGALRDQLSPAPCVVQEAPAEVRAALDPWGPVDPRALDLMARVKARFDPAGTLMPGTFVGGL